MQLDSRNEATLAKIIDERAREVLRQWASNNEIAMKLTGWSAAGFTSAQLLGVRIGESGTGDRNVVMKINPRGTFDKESRAHHAAIRHGGPFVERHLARLAERPIPLSGGGCISFQSVAGGSFTRLVPFNAMFHQHGNPAQTCATIVTSLLTEWNAVSQPASDEAAGPLLKSILATRIMPNGTLHQWASAHAGLLENPRRQILFHDLGTLANPFALAMDDADGPTVYAKRGRVHGDLHPENLLVDRSVGDPLQFCLIDLARYTDTGLLAWDPAYLMLTTAAIHLADLTETASRKALYQALLHPQRTPDPALPETLSSAITGIYAGERRYFEDRGLEDEWSALRLLCVTAIAMILSGRRILSPRSREWFFQLAALAATELLGEAAHADGPVEPLLLPRSFIKAPPDSPRRQETLPGLPQVLDRDGAKTSLRTQLRSGPWGVVVVHGSPGVGKSLLIDTVLTDMETREGLRVHRHEAIPSLPFDVRTITDDLVGATSAETACFGKSSIARFEAALGTTGDEPVVVVVESAENLLLRNGQLTDLDLDEAFEMLATTPLHRVAVVLVTSRIPVSRRDSTWASDAPVISVPGLPQKEFAAFLGQLDQRLPSGLSNLPNQAGESAGRPNQGRGLRDRFRTALRDNPRNAELAHAILALNDSEFDAVGLAEHVAALPRTDVSKRLAYLLVEGASHTHQRVLDALAAFATAVPAAAVAALLSKEVPEAKVASALRQLVDRRVVRLAPDGTGYYLPHSDVLELLDKRLRETQPEMLQNAAYQLRDLRATEVQTIADLRIHFAELDAFLRAGSHACAYPVIAAIHSVLCLWNCPHLLLDQRIEVRGRLEDSHNEMANDNALGQLHEMQGDYAAADQAYDRASRHANDRDDQGSQNKILTNIAARDWKRNRVKQAQHGYRKALEEARRQGQATVQIHALEGMADCSRRWGEYDAAIRYATAALAVPSAVECFDRADDQGATSASIVRCALKLARWYAELGQPVEATRRFEMANRVAHSRTDQWLLSACLDCQADLLLGQGHIEDAIAAATEAEDRALQVHDPVTLMQARTTLCMAHLIRDEPRLAADNIARAIRYRSDGRALVVLALQALTTMQRSDTGKAMRLFGDLQTQARARVEADRRDFGAWDFLGFAICGLRPDDPSALSEAVAAVETARDIPTSPTPGLTRRLQSMVHKLDQCGPRPGRLRPVIDALHSR